MKISNLFLLIFLPLFSNAQINESFTDGELNSNPTWMGTTSNFFVNPQLQLQSKATVSSVSYLFTPSEAFENASWEFQVMINYLASSGTTSSSSSNYAAIYIASDRNDIGPESKAYYVQVGGTRDAISLYLKNGNKADTIIGGINKRIEHNPVDIRIKLTRDNEGNFALYSKLIGEMEYVLEGKTKNNEIKNSNFFGLLFENSSKTGSAYSFDNILVTGTKPKDIEPPIWNTIKLELPNKLFLSFSEEINFSQSAFSVDNNVGAPSSQLIGADKKSITLTFSSNFETGKQYNLLITNLTDLANNLLTVNTKSIGIVEEIDSLDVIFNEVMFENPENSTEYIELFNRSNKLLDISGLIISTRKTDGTLNTGNAIPAQTLLLPKAYLTICSDAEKVRNYHLCPPSSNIINSTWSQLNNESSTLVLTNSRKDTIYDELTYNTKWHNTWVTNPKGIALERNNPELPTQNATSWHSAVSEGNYGTPGYKNSEYLDLEVPIWKSLVLEAPNKLIIEFSEMMDFTNVTFILNNEIDNIVSQQISADKHSVVLTYKSEFETGKIYTLQINGITDLAGNKLLVTQKYSGLSEKPKDGDLLFNEIMFDNAENSLEYFEIYNNSDKLLDMSTVVFTTRKTDGTLNTVNSIPTQTLLLPKGFLAVCSDAEKVRNYHFCPSESNIISCNWTTLNNENATLVLLNSKKDTIYEELSYSKKWHHALLKNTKGVALERINPQLPVQDPNSWHSAASENNYGTPGYKNSQFRDISKDQVEKKIVWAEPEAFSPDNDGVNDVCFIHYTTQVSGYVGNALILTPKGEKVFHLATNQLLSTEGILSWDGTTDKGTTANSGIYVLYFEMFNTKTGDRKIVKLPIVSSFR